MLEINFKMFQRFQKMKMIFAIDIYVFHASHHVNWS